MAMNPATINSSEHPNQLRKDARSLWYESNRSAEKYLGADDLKKIKHQHEFFRLFLLIEATMKKLATQMVYYSNTIAKEIISRRQKDKISDKDANKKFRELRLSLNKLEKDSEIGMGTSNMLRVYSQRMAANVQAIEQQAPHEGLGPLSKEYKEKLRQWKEKLKQEKLKQWKEKQQKEQPQYSKKHEQEKRRKLELLRRKGSLSPEREKARR